MRFLFAEIVGRNVVVVNASRVSISDIGGGSGCVEEVFLGSDDL